MTKKKPEKNEGKDPSIAVDMGIVTLGGIFDLVNKVVGLGANLKELESKLQEYKAQGKIRSDVDIRVSSIIGDNKEVRISSGTFFKHLDELAKERRSLAPSVQKRQITIGISDLAKTELTADIIEQEDRVYVITQVPYDEQDIEVSFKKHGNTGELTIEASKHGYKRLIPISANVDTPESGKVQWNYKNHVVEVILPRTRTG